MKNGLARWTFVIGTLSILGVVSVLIYLTGTHVIYVPPDVVASVGIVGQILLVKGREQRILRRRSWRIWYVCSSAALAILAILGIIVLRSLVDDPIKYRSQATMGFFLFFYVLCLPVLVASLLAKEVRSE